MKGISKLKAVKTILTLFVFALTTSQSFAESISLAWDPSPSTDVTGYTVYYGNASGSYSKQADAGMETSLVLQGIDRRTNYFFAVTARTSDGLESLPSNEVDLPSEKNPPQVAITAPGSSASFTTTNNAITLGGTASDDYGLAQITWSNSCSQASGVASGSTSWTVANVSLCLGANVISVTARDMAGNMGTTLITITRTELPCEYAISRSVANFAATGGNGSVDVTAGNTCNWTATSSESWVKIGSGSSGAGNGSVSFSVDPNGTCSPRTCVLTIAGKTFTLTQAAGEASVDVVRGTFNALFTGPAPQQSTAFFTLKKGTSSGFSGNIKLDGKQHSFSGKFDSTGFAEKVVNRSKSTPLTFRFVLEPCSPENLFVVITDGDWTVEFSAARSDFDSKTEPAPFAGKYTIAVAGVTSETLVRAAPETSPEGIGFATVKVLPNGMVKVAGNLGDGERFMQSAFLSTDGVWSCYVPLYRKAGLISGSLTFQPGEIDPRGDLTWVKPQSIKDRYYPQGFEEMVGVIGSPYVAPTNVTGRILNFEMGTIILGGNDFENGLAKDVVLLPNGKIAPLVRGEDRLSVQIKKDVGTFTGSIKLPGQARPVKFKGGLLQNQNAGYGLFLSTNLSGQLLLEPTQ